MIDPPAGRGVCSVPAHTSPSPSGAADAWTTLAGMNEPRTRDLSTGHSPERERVVTKRPTEPFWSENLLFTPYDPVADVGFWLHLGTVPSAWELWEDRVLMLLPGDEGVLSMCGYHRTAPERRPAGSCLEFRCIEPYRRWRIAFDGFALHTSNPEMAAGRARDGAKRRLALELDVVCVTPVWDAHDAARHATGKGAMRAQGWAKEHYEQLARVDGTVRVDGREISFHGTSWRDHSRGPRGGSGGAAWGGHVIQGCLFPSGRGFGFSCYWTPQGAITLEGGYAIDADGALHHAEVLAVPRLTGLTLSGERLPVHLRWDGGELALESLTRRSLWCAMRQGLAVGADLSEEALIYALNFARAEWDGEEGWVYSERSDMLNALAPAPRAAGR